MERVVSLSPTQLPSSKLARRHGFFTPVAAILLALTAFTGCSDEKPLDRLSPKPAEITSFQAAPTRVAPGDEVVLSWETNHAIELILTANRLLVDLGTVDFAAGSITLTVEEETTFELSAIGGVGAIARSSVLVRVDIPQEQPPRITLFEAVDPSPAAIGEMRELRWEVEDAETVQITNQAAFSQIFTDAEAAGGSVQVPMTAQGIFKLIATRGELTSEAEVTIPLEALPQIGLFVAAADQVSRELDGRAKASLSWSGVELATSLVLEGDTIEPIELAAGSLNAGSTEVWIEEDTVFTLVAKNDDGEARATVSVQVVDRPIVISFATSHTWVGMGDTVELSWSTHGATRIVIKQNGVVIPGEYLAEGTATVIVALNSTFELSAFNDTGDFDISTVHVSVGAPLIDTFEASLRSGWLGESISFAWKTLGGTGIDLVANGTTHCSTRVRAEVDEGFCVTDPITEPGTYDFTLRLSSISGQVATRSISIRMGAGPQIDSFSISPASLTAGGSVNVSWATAADPDGVAPTLSLTSTRGGPFTLPQNPSGAMALTLTEVGSYEFTLTASTTSPGSVAATATRTVTVHGAPQVSLTATPSSFDDDLHDEVVLSWTSSYAERSLILAQIFPGSAPVVLLDIPAGDRASGSYSLGKPTMGGTYRLTAMNDGGTEAQAEATVTILGTEILSFTATPPTYPSPSTPAVLEVVAGDQVELTWTTRRARTVELNFLEGLEVIESAAPYVDISAQGGTKLALASHNTTASPGDEGSAILSFPAGFSFPFNGVRYGSLVAHANGFLSFDLTAGLNAIEPDTTVKPVHLAVFGDNLFTSQTGGSVYWLQGTDATSSLKYLIVQWKGIEGWNTSRSTADLNFEAVLWENGDVEFRYGSMYSDTMEGRANGNYALIGFQYPQPATTFDWLNNRNSYGSGPGYPGGLSGRGFTFRASGPLSVQGSHDWSPRSSSAKISRTATLTATGLADEVSRSIVVDVYPRATVSPSAEAVQIRNAPATLRWSTQHATALQVVDDLGNVRCTAPANQVVIGSCEVTETASGARTYTFVATGALGHTASSDARVDVISEDFVIRSFEVLSGGAPITEVRFGQPVTLEWETSDGDTIEITANGTPLALPPTVDVNEDSFTIPSIEEDTTFVLSLSNAVDGTITATRTVSIQTLQFTLDAPITDVAPGTPVDLHYDVQSFTGETPTILSNLPMRESTGSGQLFADLDISSNPDRIQITGANDNNGIPKHDFTGGFTFPYMGQVYTSVAIATNGALSFDPNPPTSNHQNVAIPSTNANYMKMHLLPFWDDLNTWSSGRVYAAAIGADTYVIQWSKLSAAGGAASNEYDLNFMVVLRSNGSFEYRYGTMAPPPGTSSACQPQSCANEARGSSATIGYQNVTGTRAYQLHFGGTNSGVNNPIVPGGLANRSFRFDPLQGSGTFTFIPAGKRTYEICVILGGAQQCKEVSFTSEFQLLSFEPSNPTIKRGSPVMLNWEVKNGDTMTLKANDIIIATEASSNVAAGSFPHFPTETTTYVLEVGNAYLGQILSATRTVTVDQFDLNLSADKGSVRPGEAVTLSWDATRLSAGGMSLTLPMTDVSDSVSYQDLQGVLTDPDVVLSGSSNNVMVDYAFRGGFSFSYLGQTYTSVRVATDGYLSFGTPLTSNGINQAIPNTGSRDIHLAPFWDDLSTRSNGRILAGPVGSTYVIQWTQMSMIAGSSLFDHDLNFQVVLGADGSFEYRYGTMFGLPLSSTSIDCYPNDCSNEANGSSATIGYQDPSGRAGYLHHFGGTSNALANLPVADLLSGRAFRFTPGASVGSMVVHPTDTRSYQLCAIAGEMLECSRPQPIRADWEILSFTSDEPAVPFGTNVTLRWETVGADTLSLGSSPVGSTTVTPLPPLSGDPAAGSFQEPVSQATIYSLDIHSMGRTKRKQLVVIMRDVSVEVSASHQVVLPGEAVQIDWDVKKDVWVTETPAVVVPMVELAQDAPNRFSDLDISNNPNRVELFGANQDLPRAVLHDFGGGFSFPYFGAPQSSILVSVNGFASFGTNTTSRDANAPFPGTNAANRDVHLAPFWDNIHTRTTGRIYAALVDTNTYVIQWSKVSITNGSTATEEYDMNFMIVLRSDGSFEYRYGAMTPPENPLVDIWYPCYPESCVNEANASSATIGYQNIGATLTSTLHHGGTYGAPTDVPFPGGIANRTFKAIPLSKGSVTLRPQNDVHLEFCGTVTSYSECRSVDVIVARPGDLQISELQINPTGGSNLQWFEVQNLRTLPYDLSRMVLRSGTTSHTIFPPPGGLSIPPRGHVVFAASATPGGFAPDYVYGSSIFLPTGATGDIRIDLESTTLASASWDSSWTVPAGTTLMLDDAKAALGVPSHPFSAYCPSSTLYDGVNRGTPGAGEGCTYRMIRDSDRMAIDISTTGHDLTGFVFTLNSIGPVPGGLGFQMPFFDTTVSDVWVSSHGFSSFGRLTDHYNQNRKLGQAAPPFTGIVAPFWDRLTNQGAAGNPTPTTKWERLEIGGQKVLVLQWISRRVDGGGGGRMHFQTQFWENGDIVFVYVDISADSPSLHYGSSASIGIEAVGGGASYQYSYQEADAIRSGQSILFQRK